MKQLLIVLIVFITLVGCIILPVLAIKHVPSIDDTGLITFMSVVLIGTLLSVFISIMDFQKNKEIKNVEEDDETKD